MEFQPLTWATSYGGPFLLLPGEYLCEWSGTDVPSHERVVEAIFRWSGDPAAPATDYDRACDVENCLRVIPVGGGEGLVLGDEPNDTTWWATPEGGLLVQRVYRQEADDLDQQVAAALARVPSDIWEPSGLAFHVGNAPAYLFDSALSGSEVLEKGSSRVVIALPAGRYDLATARYHPDDQTELTLHRLSHLLDERKPG